MRLVEDRYAEHMAGLRVRVRVTRWDAGGVEVHRYVFLDPPRTAQLRLLHILDARMVPQIVIMQWG